MTPNPSVNVTLNGVGPAPRQVAIILPRPYAAAGTFPRTLALISPSRVTLVKAER